MMMMTRNCLNWVLIKLFDDDEMVMINFSELPLDIVVSEILKENQLFSPQLFIKNFNKLPIQIRAKWNYTSIKMRIDGKEEIIAYKITKANDLV
jgi:hypothetical protein